MNTTSKLVSCAVCAILVASSTAGAAEPATTTSEPATTARPLDLKPPQIMRIFTPEQIDAILARTVDPQLEHIEVEASRLGDLPARDRSASRAEAVFKEVVRWFAPYPSAVAARINAPPNGDSYRPVPVMLSSYHPSFPAPYSQR